MIVVKLMAGLGNQMLQYALGRHLSIKNNTSLYLDLSWFKTYNNSKHPREFKLNKFQTHYKTADPQKLIWKLRYTNHFKQANPFKLKNVNEVDYAGYDPGVLLSGDHILLEGFFNNYKYFEAIQEVLVKDFTPADPMDTMNKTWLHKIKASNSVSVHIRRGDYADTSFHGMLDKEYYAEAIKFVAEKTGALQLFIFSDEPMWVKEHMEFEHPYELINFNKDEKNYCDLELMKTCKHNIIANSTFSWWAAFLNQNPGKIVVAPKKWYKEGKSPSDMIPVGWKTF